MATYPAERLRRCYDRRMLEGLFPYLKRAIPIVVVWCAFFVGIQLASAQTVTIDPTTGNTIITPGSGAPIVLPPTGSPTNPTTGIDGVTGDRGTINPTPAQSAEAAAASQPTNQNNGIPPVIISDTDCWNSVGSFLNCVVVSFFGSLVAIAGYAFDASISLFIINFGKLYTEAGIGNTVENVWTTVRDVFNLTFIFGLVYIGFQIILGTNESGAKRTIPLLILAALLVNFSLFVVKLIIDFANLAGVQIYNLFGTSEVGDQVANTTILSILTAGDVQGPSIALAFLNTIGVAGLLNHNVTGSEGAPILYLFVMIIIFLVLTYVFFAGAILVTIRFAVLIFYMIFSPIMFLGWVFPGLKSYSDKFWTGLFGQAFFAPAFLFMLYISYQLARGFNDGQRTGVSEAGEAPNNVAAYAQFMPYLIVVVIFLLGSLIIARKMANQGADMVGKINDWAVGKAQSVVGRNTIGRMSSGMYNINEKLDGTRTGRNFKRLVTAASLGTFDERTRREVFEAGKKAKFGGSYSRADDKAFAKEQANRVSDQKDRVDNKKAIAAGLKALETPESARTPEQHATVQKMAGVVSKMGVGDVEKMDAKTRVNIAEFFTHPLMEKISDSKELTDVAKYEIKSARKEAMKKLIGQVGEEAATITAEVAKLTIEQIEELGDDWVMKHADILTSSQMDKIKDSKKFNPYQKNQFTASRSKSLSTSSRTRDYFYQIKADKSESRRKAAEVAGLGRDVFMRSDDAALEHLNVDILEAIADKKTLGADDRRSLAVKINGLSTSVNKEADNMRDWLRSPQGLRTWGGSGTP